VQPRREDPHQDEDCGSGEKNDALHASHGCEASNSIIVPNLVWQFSVVFCG
jgi:hypothetical protein